VDDLGIEFELVDVEFDIEEWRIIE
jgi:hypothetical protein